MLFVPRLTERALTGVAVARVVRRGSECSIGRITVRDMRGRVCLHAVNLRQFLVRRIAVVRIREE
jgi:hypothetical protein